MQKRITCDVIQPKPEPADDHHGFQCRVAGLYNSKPYCVDVWCEHDGRDVEFEPVWGADIREDMDFFDVLCENTDFMEAFNADSDRYHSVDVW
jgi:hypothetical protein